MGVPVTLFPKIWKNFLSFVTDFTRTAPVLECKIVYFIIFKKDVGHHNKFKHAFQWLALAE